ncbi:unnamed protein product [Leptidea sinapis]|uniref:ZAD domain-containing protein n=1 Tax=Leptidea sinapis TaxID=189913 RepID=A0A5E4QMQ0_9NEOP|nr:unnamed protein product [Leptidea sinapis]
MKMEKIKKEYLLGRCKCCLDDTDLQSMWEEYSVNGESEVYGEMVLQCFGVNWHSTSDSDVICSSCVTRLRDAISFKHEIIASEQLLQEDIPQDLRTLLTYHGHHHIPGDLRTLIMNHGHHRIPGDSFHGHRHKPTICCTYDTGLNNS